MVHRRVSHGDVKGFHCGGAGERGRVPRGPLGRGGCRWGWGGHVREDIHGQGGGGGAGLGGGVCDDRVGGIVALSVSGFSGGDWVHRSHRGIWGGLGGLCFKGKVCGVGMWVSGWPGWQLERRAHTHSFLFIFSSFSSHRSRATRYCNVGDGGGFRVCILG